MKTKYLPLLALLLSAYACSSGSDEAERLAKETGAPTVELTFRFFDETMTPIAGEPSRADEPKDYFTRLDICLFPAEGTQADTYTFHQLSSDADFGSLSAVVAAGTYDLVAIAHRADAALTMTSPTSIAFPNGKVTDMLYVCQSVDAQRGKTTNVSLERGITRLVFRTTDFKPEDVKTMRFAFSGNCGNVFNARTGLAAAANAYSVDIDVTPIAATNRVTTNLYTLLTAETATVNVGVTALNASNDIVAQETFSDVNMKRGYQTTLTGAFFTTDNTFSFSFPESFKTWEEFNTVSY
jgi:hypothetical protein